MRIATWNLQRGGRSRAARQAQEAVLRDLRADLIVLTEPGDTYQEGVGIVTSPARQSDQEASEPWVAIVGRSVEPVVLDVPFERMAVAATTCVNDVRLLVYGSVLPWGLFPRDALQARETGMQGFLRVLHEQTADIGQLRQQFPKHVVIWAGDFNQTLSGRNQGGSAAKREALLRAIDKLGLKAWNAGAAHAADGLHAIDLICGPREVAINRQGRIDPVLDGVTMTDHAGYWVEI